MYNVTNVKELYRPLEVERHPDGCAAGYRALVRSQDTRLPGSEGARRFGGDDVLRMLETNPEKDVAVSRPPAEAPCRAERVNFQFKYTR